MALLTTEKIGDLDVEIHVHPRTGDFEVRADGEYLGRADTLAKAMQQARSKASQRRVRVSIPFITKAGERGEATGIHAKTRSILARIDGEAHQLTHREAQVFPADMPPGKLARFLELDREIRERQRESRAIETEYTFDLAAQVQREIVAKAQETTT